MTHTTPEAWRPVAGYEGLYEVSDQRRSLQSPQGSPPDPPAAAHVHSLVLSTFTGLRPSGLVCRHLDGNPRNNTVGNLAWGTSSENKWDQGAHGTDGQSSKTVCKWGHPYDTENTYWYKSGRARGCKECRRNAVRRRRAAAKESV